MAIIYIVGLSFPAALSTTRRPETKRRVMWRLRSEVTVVVVRHFSFLSLRKKRKKRNEIKANLKSKREKSIGLPEDARKQ